MRRLEDERGGVAVFIAVCLTIFFGFAALAVDVGAMYAERRQLQNGADAGALAIAEDCARDVVDCVASNLPLFESTAQTYADANANDDASLAENVDLDLANNRVTVTTLTQDAATASNTFSLFFARVLGFDETEIRAQATAFWDIPPKKIRIFPLAFCLGKFNDVTTDGNNYGPPSYRIYYKHAPAIEVVDCDLAAEDGTNDTYAGGFGWLDVAKNDFYDVDANCRVIASAGEWYPGRPGAGLPNNAPWTACVDYIDDTIDAVAASGEADPCGEPDGDVEPLLVPIFDNHRGNGEAGDFRVVGFGAFCPTGYRFSGWASYGVPSGNLCQNPNNRCIRGWFSKFVALDDAMAGGGLDLGLTTFGLTN